MKIVNAFKGIGYNVSFKMLDANDYGVPQERKRVIVVGYHEKLGKKFEFPSPLSQKLTLKDAISDLPEATPASHYNKTNGKLDIYNHEYMNGGFSTIYMSRNRVRNWDEPSFTIQAGGRHAPCHPKAPKMKLVGEDKREFIKGKENLYRRLSIRECARIQTFPDDFVFHYDNVADGYKMIGSAVPVRLAEALAKQIMKDLKEIKTQEKWQTNLARQKEAQLCLE